MRSKILEASVQELKEAYLHALKTNQPNLAAHFRALLVERLEQFSVSFVDSEADSGVYSGESEGD